MKSAVPWSRPWTHQITFTVSASIVLYLDRLNNTKQRNVLVGVKPMAHCESENGLSVTRQIDVDCLGCFSIMKKLYLPLWERVFSHNNSKQRNVLVGAKPMAHCESENGLSVTRQIDVYCFSCFSIMKKLYVPLWERVFSQNRPTSPFYRNYHHPLVNLPILTTNKIFLTISG